MGDLTKNLSRIEVACKCGCGFDTADIETVNNLQECVDHFSAAYGVPVYLHVSSGCRCLEYNRNIGSKDTSQHVLGRAIDFYLYLVQPKKLILEHDLVAQYLDALHGDKYGIGVYPTFVHLDTKTGTGRRW